MDLRRLFWLMFPLALAGLLVAGVACGGDDDDDDNGGDATNQEDEGDGGTGGNDDDDADSDDGDEPTGSDDDGSSDDGDDGGSTDDGDDDGGTGGSTGGGSSGSSGGSGDGLARLQQTANALNDTTYFVTYDIQADGLDGTFTFASEPPTALFGLEGEFEGESGQFMIITDDEFIWFCTDSGGEQGCLKLKAGDAGFMPEIPNALQADELAQDFVNGPGVTAEPAPSQTIAGIEGECYNVTSEGSTALICFGGGVILLMEGTVDGMDLSFEAQQVETDPSAIEITVPDWPVQDLTDLGN